MQAVAVIPNAFNIEQESESDSWEDQIKSAARIGAKEQKDGNEKTRLLTGTMTKRETRNRTLKAAKQPRESEDEDLQKVYSTISHPKREGGKQETENRAPAEEGKRRRGCMHLPGQDHKEKETGPEGAIKRPRTPPPRKKCEAADSQQRHVHSVAGTNALNCFTRMHEVYATSKICYSYELTHCTRILLELQKRGVGKTSMTMRSPWRAITYSDVIGKGR